MATTMGRADAEHAREVKALAGGSFMEVVAGAGAVVLPILGLLGLLPLTFTAIAFIAIGGAMMMQGGSLGALHHAPGTARPYVGAIGSGVLGGAAVTALGIISLFRLAPMTLLPVAAIVAGAALIVGSGRGAAQLVHHEGTELGTVESRHEVVRESVRTAAGADLLVGLAAIVLGILVLAGLSTPRVHLTMMLIAALALGAALFLNGTTVGARMSAILHH